MSICDIGIRNQVDHCEDVPSGRTCSLKSDTCDTEQVEQCIIFYILDLDCSDIARFSIQRQ